MFILYLSFLFCFLVSILLGSLCPTNKSCYHIQLGDRNSEKFTHLYSRSLAIMDLTFIISSVSRVQDMWQSVIFPRHEVGSCRLHGQLREWITLSESVS